MACGNAVDVHPARYLVPAAFPTVTPTGAEAVTWPCVSTAFAVRTWLPSYAGCAGSSVFQDTLYGAVVSSAKRMSSK